MGPSTAPRPLAHYAFLCALVLSLPACNTFERLSEVGSGHSLGKIEDPRTKPGYMPVSMPIPTPTPALRNPNSLWRSGARSFYSDQRATQIGDILHVAINIADNGKMNINSNRTRGPNTEAMGVPVLPPGLQNLYAKAFGTNPLAINSNSASVGVGVTARAEAIIMNLSAVVNQILPNGNLIIGGTQQVKLNSEMRELTISGIVRPADIDSSNSIDYSKIAEARISYGGKGYASDVQAPRYGQELLDILLPF